MTWQSFLDWLSSDDPATEFVVTTVAMVVILVCIGIVMGVRHLYLLCTSNDIYADDRRAKRRLQKKHGSAALLHATARRQSDVAQLLMPDDAEKAARACQETDDTGRTVLHWAAVNQIVPVARYAMLHVPELAHTPDSEGHTPRDLARGKSASIRAIFSLDSATSSPASSEAAAPPLFGPGERDAPPAAVDFCCAPDLSVELDSYKTTKL